jgi:GNAT superfamily N-acetyltransferase
MRTEHVIREALARDLDAMVGLLRQLFAIEDDFPFDEQKQRHGCAALMADHGRSVLLIAEANRSVVGMCSVQVTISTAEGGMSALVEDMIVDAAWRGKGIGSSLLAAAASWANDRQCVRMQLLADNRNGAAIGFYRSAGWHRTNMVGFNRKIFAEQFSAPALSHHAAMSTRR